MKASEMVDHLQAFIRSIGDLDLIYASDDEGNSFHKITITTLSACHFYDDGSQEASFEIKDIKDINAVCIN